jgi:hypothetical protein
VPKAVDILYYATIPVAYDVALLLTGDRDFLPAVIRCQQKGWRIGIVRMRCTASIAFEETANLKDYDTVWLEDYIEQWNNMIDRPLTSSSNKRRFLLQRLPSNYQTANASVRKTTTKVSEYVLNKVVSDSILLSKEPKVSSRDLGRVLKNLEFGDKISFGSNQRCPWWSFSIINTFGLVFCGGRLKMERPGLLGWFDSV